MRSSIEFGPTHGAVWAADANTRSQFIIRTYLHLFGALLAFTLIEFAVFASGLAEPIALALFGAPGGWLLVLGGFMVVSWFASRAAHTARSKTAQYVALAGFVAAEALIFVPLLYIANSRFPGVISSAALLTVLGFAGLTAIAFISRKDFSFLRGLLMWGGVCALGAIIASVLFGFTLGPFFSAAMVAFAGAAVLYDTSNVLHHYPKDRYVGAALELFASIALMLWYVIRLLMASRD